MKVEQPKQVLGRKPPPYGAMEGFKSRNAYSRMDADGDSGTVTSAVTSALHTESTLPCTNQHHSSYVEFNPGTVPCPTCKGSGRIPKEHEHQMVAIIPLSDKRLKPGKGHIYVIAGLVACLLTGGLLLLFLIPRPISIISNSPKITPLNVVIDTSRDNPYLNLEIVVEYNITNQNYFAVQVDSLTVNSMYGSKVVGLATNATTVHIGLRKQVLHSVQMNITFEKDYDEGGYVPWVFAVQCYWIPYWDLIFLNNAVASFSYYNHAEEATLATYQYVKCNP